MPSAAREPLLALAALAEDVWCKCDFGPDAATNCKAGGNDTRPTSTSDHIAVAQHLREAHRFDQGAAILLRGARTGSCPGVDRESRVRAGRGAAVCALRNAI